MGGQSSGLVVEKRKRSPLKTGFLPEFHSNQGNPDFNSDRNDHPPAATFSFINFGYKASQIEDHPRDSCLGDAPI